MKTTNRNLGGTRRCLSISSRWKGQGVKILTHVSLEVSGSQSSYGVSPGDEIITFFIQEINLLFCVGFNFTTTRKSSLPWALISPFWTMRYWCWLFVFFLKQILLVWSYCDAVGECTWYLLFAGCIVRVKMMVVTEAVYQGRTMCQVLWHELYIFMKSLAHYKNPMQ